MLSKELLNKNRILTMSNNRTCDQLIVNIGCDSTIMMTVSTRGGVKDILLIKEIFNKNLINLTDVAYWVCREFGIHEIMTDGLGIGREFYNLFKNKLPKQDINISFSNLAKYEAAKKLEIAVKQGTLRLLQTPECAFYGYRKPFLGFSEVMNSHLETDKLLDEIDNIEYRVTASGNYVLMLKNSEINRARLDCLLYCYTDPK